MDLGAFVYRRLTRILPCRFYLGDGRNLRLQSKYEIASFQDVFCQPFYWQVFSWLERPPAVVVDCGAHCGHFTLLADQCIRARYPTCKPQYFLIEPNPGLIQILRRTLQEANLAHTAQITRGLVGKSGGEATLWVNPHNYLSASVTRQPGTVAHVTQYVDLFKLVGDRDVDLLKIDVEGSEFDLIGHQLESFRRVRLLVIEVHGGDASATNQLIAQLASVGLNLACPLVEAAGQHLGFFRRSESAEAAARSNGV